MNIIGVDYSITSPAICINMGEKFYFLSHQKKYTDWIWKDKIFGYSIFKEMKVDTKHSTRKYDIISTWAIDIINRYKPCYCVLEGYSYGSINQSMSFNIAENTQALKQKIYKENIDMDIVPPSSCKKAFTGKGNATKFAMYVAFTEKTGIDLSKIFDTLNVDKNPISDLVDSYALCHYFINKDKNR